MNHKKKLRHKSQTRKINPWKKILYKEYNKCDDNFTHESFLEDMVSIKCHNFIV